VGKGRRKDQRDKPPRNPKLEGKTSETKCPRCLGSPHPKQECPAKESKYNKCLIKGNCTKTNRSKLKKKRHVPHTTNPTQTEKKIMVRS